MAASLKETVDGEPTREFRTLKSWRDWLEKNGAAAKPIWLIIYKKGASGVSVGWHEAIEHALCFAWVDSKAKKRDPDSVYLRFGPRNPKSNWGPRNKERVERLIAGRFMRPAGQALVDLAKKEGRW